jgi:5-methyltetrahydropteroyltriglutamate--homocysteine methyltransferase
MPQDVLFPASVVGSMPRSDFVKDLIAQDTTLPPAEYERKMKAAIAYIVAVQEHAGLDVITDGEWWRKSYIGVIAELAHGFELSQTPDGRPFTVVTEKLSAKKPGFIAKEASFLKSITKKKIKVTLPAPALLGERMWDPEKSKKAYPKREDFIRDCVPVLKRELELLQKEGAHIVQIDDPHLCLFVDDEVRSKYPDPEKASDFAVDMVNGLLDGVKGLKIAVHLCRRAGGRARNEVCFHGGYDPIVNQLNKLKVNHLTMEFTTPGAGDMAVFKKLREDFEIGLGCVGTTPGVIDSAETIVERVEKALKHLPAERITLNPDCGFAPGSGAKVSIDEAYQKICNEAEAARILRERHGVSKKRPAKKAVAAC